MKRIELYTACLSNSGRRLPAGTKVAVGAGKAEISSAQAGALVADGSAADASPAVSTAKKSAK